MSWVKYSPSTLPATPSVWKEGFTFPWTTGLASSPSQAALDLTPGNAATRASRERSGDGTFTSTSLALMACR